MYSPACSLPLLFFSVFLLLLLLLVVVVVVVVVAGFPCVCVRVQSSGKSVLFWLGFWPWDLQQAQLQDFLGLVTSVDANLLSFKFDSQEL